ncbi:MAG: hypothetical protein ABUL77_00470 [Bacteroidota bacterium]
MPGLLSIAALLVVAAEIDVNGTVTGEVRVGQGPLVSSQAPRAGVIAVVTPVGDVMLFRPDLELMLDYGPRIFWREPNGTARVRPLILHSSNLSLRARPTQSLSLLGLASGSVGEPDYSALSTYGGSGAAATLPTVVNLLSLSARVAAVLATTRIWDLGLAVEGAHRRPLGQPPGADPNIPTVVLPRQTTLRVEPTASAHLTRRDDLLLLSSLSYQTYSNGAEYLLATAEVGGRRRLTPRFDLRLVAGVAYLKTLGRITTMPNAPTPPALRPIGTAELQGRIIRGNNVALSMGTAVRVEYYVDPVLALAVPRGTLSARCSLLLGQDWMASIEGAFSTNISAEPFALGTDQSQVFETVASVSLPVRHRISHHMVLEFGGRWSDRGSHLRASDFEFRQRQLWAYGMLTWTTRDLAEWLTPESSPTEIRRFSRPPVAAPARAPGGVGAADDLRVRQTEGGTAPAGMPLPGSASPPAPTPPVRRTPITPAVPLPPDGLPPDAPPPP